MEIIGQARKKKFPSFCQPIELLKEKVLNCNQKIKITWKGRKYDKNLTVSKDPTPPNIQSINV